MNIDLGDGVVVRRVLPQAGLPSVGPFVFIDEMGPVDFAPGQGFDVRPHPHIGLWTLTYLFEGSILHRDSLGSEQVLRPGGVNWMRAGRGIVHSERTPPEQRASGGPAHGLQMWVALPTLQQECEPRFTHLAPEQVHTWREEALRFHLLVGPFSGRSAKIEPYADFKAVVIEWDAPQRLSLAPWSEVETAIYLIRGPLQIEGESDMQEGELTVLQARMPGPDITRSLVHTYGDKGTKLLFISGSPVEPRHLWWNFVSTSRDRIEQAKDDWRHGRFASVPGDPERIPLPEG
ncbi:MAG: pirin family protein [Polyangiales bacterium]